MKVSVTFNVTEVQLAAIARFNDARKTRTPEHLKNRFKLRRATAKEAAEFYKRNGTLSKGFLVRIADVNQIEHGRRTARCRKK